MLFDTLLEDYSALNKEPAEGEDGENEETKSKTKVSSSLFFIVLFNFMGRYSLVFSECILKVLSEVLSAKTPNLMISTPKYP